MNYARNALLHEDLSITELAEYLGYGSLFLFQCSLRNSSESPLWVSAGSVENDGL